MWRTKCAPWSDQGYLICQKLQSCKPISIKGADSACYLPPGFSYLSTALGKVGKYRFIDFPKPQMVLQVQSELVGSIRSANVDLRLKKLSTYVICCIIKLLKLRKFKYVLLFELPYLKHGITIIKIFLIFFVLFYLP